MRVLGVTSSSTDLRWALMEGTRGDPALLECEPKTQRLVLDGDESQRLLALKNLVKSRIRDHDVTKISICRAGRSQYQASSPSRVKAECVVQIAAAESTVDIELVSPQTLRAQEKRFSDYAGDTPEAVLNDGDNFSPRPWRDAVLVAWIGLDE